MTAKKHFDYEAIYADLFEYMQDSRLAPWLNPLKAQLHTKFVESPHGDLDRWRSALDELPLIEDVQTDLNAGPITTTTTQSFDKEAFEESLRKLIPWRKGPFELFGTHINTEWRSDWKWDRVAPHISPLENRTILDVGCGSGYHCWRMLGAGARRVIGIDPSYLFLMQFETVKRYAGPQSPIHLLPVKMEDVPAQLEAFDTTFSMGVLYHRRSPIDHLYELKGTLKPGGELVLETLVVEGPNGHSLVPEDRYAMMRNVWFIPSEATLEAWLIRCGFKDVRCVESNYTSMEEQRVTDWMRFQSLEDFLDPNDHSKTVEGLPAPKRATFLARKPK